MKRLFKRIINCFSKFFSDMCWEEKLIISISVFLGILLGVIFFTSVDIVPATASDYEIFYGYSEEIHKSPETLLDMIFDEKCSASVIDNEKVIRVYFEDDECKLVVEYNKDFEIVSSSEVDKASHWLPLLIFSIVISILGAFASYFMLALWIVSIEGIIEYIKEKLKKNNSKSIK